MRGRPLIEWLCFVAAWTLLLIPLLHVTGGGASRPVAAVSPDGAGAVRVAVWLRVTFSESPESLVAYSGGVEVWRETAVPEDAEHLVELVMGTGGPDLEIEVQWPREGRRAVAIVVDPVEGRPWRALLWSERASLRERLALE